MLAPLRGVECSAFGVRRLVLPLLLCAALVHGAEIQLTAEASSRQIFLGESVTLTVKVSGLRDAPVPDLSGIPNCSFILQGSQDQSYQHVTIVNGKMQRRGFRGRAFTYVLTPTTSGAVDLVPIRLSHGGRVYQTSGPRLNVVGVEEQDQVLLKLGASRHTVIVDEPFDVTLSVSIRRLEGGYADVDPFDTSNPPDLTIPYLQFRDVPGLEGEDVQALLQSLLTSGRRGAGLGINGLTVRQDPINSIFSFESLAGESRAFFRFKRAEETINGKAYLTYRLRTRYTPKQEDTHVFGPVTFKGGVFTDVDTAGQARSRRLFTTTSALTVRVVPPPAADRPVSYVGAIGSNIFVEATLDTQTCNVGDPLRLSLTIQGPMSVDNLRAPVLSKQERVTHAFRVYDDTVESNTLADGKTFTYTVRPIRAGTLEFPPIDVAYYNSDTRTYEVVQTAPLPIVAYQADEVQESFIVAATNDAARLAHEDGDGVLILAPIMVNPAGAEPHLPWLQTWQRVILALGPLVFLLVGAGVFVRLHLTTTAESRRRKAAMAEALVLVERAERKAGRSAAEARTLLLTGLRKYLANRWGRSEGGITPRDAARLLREHEVEPEVAQALVDVLDRSFNAEYDPSAASGQDVQADAHSTRSALKRLEKLALTMGLIMGLAGSAGADSVKHWFLWEEANTHMATAVEPRDYLAAAETYRELYALGVQNGPLLYNMGTAFLLAGRHDIAQRALGGAEIYLGTTRAIERNMLLAMMGDDPEASAILPWYRLPLFWHYGTPLRRRMAVTILAITAAWLAGTMRWLGWRRGWREVLAGMLAVIVLGGSSVLLSLHELNRVRSDLTLLSYRQGVEQEGAP